MKWADIGQTVGRALPWVGSLLMGKAGEKVGEVIAGVLGVDPTPDNVARALAENPEAYVKLQEALINQRVELERMAFSAETSQQTEINKTMRVEAQSKDKFTSRWRPMFGYCMAITWTLLVFSLCFTLVYTALTNPAHLVEAITASGGLSANLAVLFGIPMAVLGISIKQRSNDKKLDAGVMEAGLMDKFTNLFKK